MEDHSVFMNPDIQPTDAELQDKLAETYKIWKFIECQVLEEKPVLSAEWNFGGKKFGWNFRIKDKKRAIIYMLPREGFFKVAFVFGEKAFGAVMQSSVPEQIKIDLASAKKYAEGRGVRIEVRGKSLVNDIIRLVKIKHEF